MTNKILALLAVPVSFAMFSVGLVVGMVTFVGLIVEILSGLIATKTSSVDNPINITIIKLSDILLGAFAYMMTLSTFHLMLTHQDIAKTRTRLSKGPVNEKDK